MHIFLEVKHSALAENLNYCHIDVFNISVKISVSLEIQDLLPTHNKTKMLIFIGSVRLVTAGKLILDCVVWLCIHKFLGSLNYQYFQNNTEKKLLHTAFHMYFTFYKHSPLSHVSQCFPPQ